MIRKIIHMPWRIKRALKLCLLPYYYFTNPIKFNNILNEYERIHGKTRLFSYPVSFGLNTSNICNQKCRFCSHNNNTMKSTNWLTSSDIEKMKWLRFVKNIQLFAGNGDPLTNPNFPDIARTARRIAPHSKLQVFTNGLALYGENLNAALESLDSLHISLNAARRETYDQIIEGGNFDRVMKNLSELSERRPSHLSVEISMILMKSTQNDIIPMIDLVEKLGFQKFNICHFITTMLDDQEFGEGESLKAELKQETWNEYQQYAKERGIDFFFPTTIEPPQTCLAPWMTAFITNDVVGDRIFVLCCSGIEPNIYVSKNVYSDFRSAWNSPRVQHIRATVNTQPLPENNICYLCKQLDRTDPDWQLKIRALAAPLEDVTFNPKELPKAFAKEVII